MPNALIVKRMCQLKAYFTIGGKVNVSRRILCNNSYNSNGSNGYNILGVNRLWKVRK